MRLARLIFVAGAAAIMLGCKAQTPAVAGAMTLSLPAIATDRPIPARFTCDGADRSPAVQWGHVPGGTRSLALVVDDPDAPGGIFHHWGAFNIDAQSGQLPEGAGNAANPRFRQSRNDFGAPGYKGPCPPPGNGAHRYRFKLFALDIARLDVAPSAPIVELERAMDGHILDKAVIIASYQRD